MNVIECNDLRRTFGKKKFIAVDGLDLAVPKGSVFCLLGPNGAGKTTTIRILSTLLTPTSGNVSVLGYNLNRETKKIRKKIGLILGGDRGLYGRLTGRENLRYFAALNHMSKSEMEAGIADALQTVGLEKSQDRLVEQYSRGMRQRLHVARGILTNPDLIFMDEPTIGLDPEGAQELRQLVPKLISKGKTILLTTHYMFEADELSDNVAVINHGKLIALGSPTEIKRKFSKINVFEMTLNSASTQLANDLRKSPGISNAYLLSEELTCKLVLHTEPGFKLSQDNIELIGEANIQTMVQRDPTLEEAYLSILKSD